MKLKKLTKTIIILTGVIIMAFGFGGCKEKNDAGSGKTPSYKGVQKPIVTMVIKNYGTVKLELEPEVAPITVSNFVTLANSGFYNGLTFHRIIDKFMIQGGDPEGTGNGGPDYSIKGEFKVNGVKNDISHVKGVISMARAKPYDTAGSQFFICVADSTYLDGQYAAFGRVTEGLDIVVTIGKVSTDYYDRPLTPVIIESVSVETFGVDYSVYDKIK